MKIKKIDVTGFKSFMEKTALTFPEKITAIVGPNGCGKSNLVDSIRWVIGEQSPRHLRGKGMDDMIFNGSEKSSPLGMAEVKITFTNENGSMPAEYSEYNEITISRRLFKSGESEYMINNTRCRLLDIKELFMDTGISAKAYAIVEQGKVDTIVNSRPEDKRLIIDEAAGITKYKSRKDAALKKIASTQQNLQRTKDILSEIKKQLNSVERQAKKAEEFKKLRKELKDIELKLIRLDDINVKKKLESIGKELKGQDNKSVEISKKLKIKENDLESKKIGNLETEKEHIAAQELYLNRLNEVKKKETEIEFKERRRGEIFEQKNSNLSEIEDLKSMIKELKKEKEGLKQKIKTAEDEFSNEENKVLTFLKEYEGQNKAFKEKTTLIDKEKSVLINTLTNIARTKNDTANFEQHITSFEKTREKLKKEKDFLDEQISKISKDVKNLDSTRSQVEKDEKELQERSVQNELRLNELNDIHNEKTETVNTLDGELKDISARLNSLVELKNSYEGFNAGVKALMNAKDSLDCGDDLLGVIADFIEVKPSYETAVSSFLGERLEHIVVTDKETIVKSVDYLKKDNKGKAGFVLLKSGKTVKKSEFDLPHLLSYVNVKKGFEGAFVDIFSDIYYIDTFASAFKRYHNDSGKTFVTKDGDVINGMIYGGSVSIRGEKILARDREIKELEQKKLELVDVFNAEEKIVTDMKAELKKEEEAQEEIKDAQHDVHIRSIDLQNKVNRSKEEAARLKGREDIIKFELEDLKKQTDEMNNKLLLSKVKLEELSSDKKKKEALIDTHAGECGRLNKTLESKSEALTAAKVNVARLKAEKENISKSILHLKDTIDTNSKRADKLKSSVDTMDKEEADLKLKVKTLEDELRKAILTSEKDKKNVEKLKETFEKNMELLRNGELELSGIKNESTAITNKKNELSLKKEEALLSLGNIEERLKEKYQKSLEDINEMELADNFNKDSAVKKLEALRWDIHDMGEVNLLAIEEFEELNERYTFMTEQQDDLLKSIDTLNKAIKRINKTSRKRFKETFELVNEKFKTVFPRLFNGGHAELRLSDEENLLETGVEIVAQPPGKKLQIISLLSGGEKALTAVSLIFAIFMIKPSPFCLLDEVDAPLDDANIGRFTDLVKEMAQSSQFIIITHSKSTMEIADTLYGVTMESPGISKIVSVQMN
jgi:chromosome segregation protein